MKHIIFFILSFIILTGCNKHMNTIDLYLDNLIKSTSASAEQESLIKINDYSRENKIPYSLEVVSKKSKSPIDISDISAHENEELEVSIIFDSGKYKKLWHPQDNKNIFILLRE